MGYIPMKPPMPAYAHIPPRTMPTPAPPRRPSDAPVYKQRHNCAGCGAPMLYETVCTYCRTPA